MRDEAGRIRTDSKVKVVPKGLLGDKMVEITRGTPEASASSPGASSSSAEPEDLLSGRGMAGKANRALDRASKKVDRRASPTRSSTRTCARAWRA